MIAEIIAVIAAYYAGKAIGHREAWEEKKKMKKLVEIAEKIENDK